jgi:biotin carboxylase
MKRIVVLNGSKKIIRYAKSLGIEVILLYEPNEWDETNSGLANHAYTVHFEDHAELLKLARSIYETRPFDYVLSLTEKGLIPAAILNDTFQLPGNTLQTVSFLKDKWVMRQGLNSVGLSPVVAARGTTREDIETFIRQHSLPVILKPIDGAGSYSVLALRVLQDVSFAWQILQRNDIHSFLMEEFLDGPEVSVEAFSFHGKHVILAITDKRTNAQFIEIGHAIPSQLNGSVQEDVKRLVQDFLQVAQMKEGPSHTEVKLTSHGPRIIESHNRVGGDKINKLVSIAYGIDMITLTVAWPFGYSQELEVAPEPLQGAAVCFFSAQPGVVKRISGFIEVQNHQQVVEAELFVGENDYIPILSHSPDRPGYVVTKGETASTALALGEQLARGVHIETDVRLNAVGESL